MLSEKLKLPAFSMEEARKTVKTGEEIIYLGWIMAGKIKGYPEASCKYKVRAVCGVGMGQTGTQLPEVRAKNNIPQSIQSELKIIFHRVSRYLHYREPLTSKSSMGFTD